MKSGRKFLIQSNVLWAGIFLAMAALFLLAFAVQIGAAPLMLPTGTPQAYLPIIYGAGGTATPSPTPGGCTPSRGFAQLASGAAPYGSAVDEVSGYVFVADHGSAAQPSGITVLNGTTVVGAVSKGSYTIGGAWGVAYNPVNQRIYVTDEGAGQLLIVNPSSRTVEKTLGGLASPRGVAIDRGTGTAYVASSGDAMLRRYTLTDVANGGEGVGLNVGNWPTGVAVDKEGRIWVTTQGELVRVTWAGSTSATWKRGLENSFGIAYSASTDRLYVTTGGSSSLTVFSVPATADPPVEISGSPFKTSPEYNLDWLALNESAGRLYIAGRIPAGLTQPKVSKLWVFDTATTTFDTPPLALDSWNDGTMMRGVSLDKLGRVYASSEFSDRVYVFTDCGSNPTPTPTPTTQCVPSSGFAQLDSGAAPYGQCSGRGVRERVRSRSWVCHAGQQRRCPERHERSRHSLQGQLHN